MALTPEDVVNKRFQPTKFREGYDQDEVDDFLDEVVVELRRLNQENEELRQRLISNDSRINELQRSAGETPAPAQDAAPAEDQAPAQEAPAAEAAPQPQTQAFEAAPAPAFGAPPAAAPPQTSAFAAPASEANDTNNLLQLARRLHEEHVREGVEKKEALIAEAQETATRLVQEAEAARQSALQEAEAARHEAEAARQSAQQDADNARQAALQEAEAAKQSLVQEAEATKQALVQEAEATQRALIEEAQAAQRAAIGNLENERQGLEQKVDELRTFEREYREKLKGYIEGQLRELDSNNVLAGGGAPQQGYSEQPPTSTFSGFAGGN